MFETYVDVKHTREDFYIEELEGNFDGLNFLANQNMSVVNHKAMEGTILAHTDGGVPLGLIEVDSLSAHDVGELIYFFWRACAVSGYLLSVNPFDSNLYPMPHTVTMVLRQGPRWLRSILMWVSTVRSSP